jgi:hypothetical protein
MRMIRRLGRAGAVLALAISLGTGCQPVSASNAPLATAQMTADEMPRISAVDLKKRIAGGESIVIVDTRGAPSFQDERVKGAVNYPFGVTGQDFSQLPKDRFIALYCT